jgi:hypothetical protein
MDDHAICSQIGIFGLKICHLATMEDTQDKKIDQLLTVYLKCFLFCEPLSRNKNKPVFNSVLKDFSSM